MKIGRNRLFFNFLNRKNFINIFSHILQKNNTRIFKIALGSFYSLILPLIFVLIVKKRVHFPIKSHHLEPHRERSLMWYPPHRKVTFETPRVILTTVIKHLEEGYPLVSRCAREQNFEDEESLIFKIEIASFVHFVKKLFTHIREFSTSMLQAAWNFDVFFLMFRK